MRRRVSSPCLAAAALLALLAGCGASVRRLTTERIGGVERVRSFASATAYEAFLRAELAVVHGDLPAAARQLELAEVADPGDAYLVARRAEVLLLAGERAEALSVARAATRRFPDSAAAWLALGEVLTEAGDRANASNALTRALAAAPDDPEVRGAVARIQGATPAQVAHAIETAPDALPGDRTVARRLALDPLRDDRPTLRTARRERARRAWERRAFREVDLILTPIVTADPTNVTDRVMLIEARARDGRPGDAARLVAGVPISAGARGVTPAARARLWLLAGRADVAAEEAERAYAAEPGNVLARVVLGEALVSAGGASAARGVALLAGVPADSPRFVDARIAAGRGLALAGRADLADAVLARSVALASRDDAIGRDRLRLARAALMLARGAAAEAREVLAATETSLGRQRRGAMLAHAADPTSVLADLRVRSGDRAEDAIADAWIALVCAQQPAACQQGERDRALTTARARVGGAPETLRALAATAGDRRLATDLLRAAAARDPLSPWNGVLSRQLGASGRSQRGP